MQDLTSRKQNRREKDYTRTEGIKYAGSKRLLLPHLLRLVGSLGVKTVFDGFSGTTRVAQALARSGYRVICNDQAPWSAVFARCYLLNTRPPDYYQPLIDHLNHLPPADGWFTAHYGGEPNGGCAIQTDGKKRPWQLHNTRRLDAIRPEIDRVTEDNVERAVLLTSLILALDRVDNTVGHYVSYLKKWSPRSYNTLRLKVPQLLQAPGPHRVSQADIFDVVEDVEACLAYYDPPYGSANEKMPPSRVRYASYYHIWKTIILNDQPALVGAANRRADVSDPKAASAFEEFRRGPNGRYLVIDTLERLLRKTPTRHIILSYSNGGRLTLGELLEMIESLNLNARFVEVDHRRHVMASMKWTNEWVGGQDARHKEYLIHLQRGSAPGRAKS